MPDYLLNRNGTYYYQRRIPASILRKFPSKSPVLRISLGTGRKSEAKNLSHKLSHMFDEFAKSYFDTEEEYTKALMLFNKYRNVTCSSILGTEDIEGFFEKYGKSAAGKIGKINRIIDARNSEILPQYNVRDNNVNASDKNDSPMVASLVDRFIDYQKRKNDWGKSNSSEIKYRLALKYLVELIDKPTNKLCKGDIVKVKELLIKLPDVRRHQFYSKLSIKELHKKDIPREHTISNNTIKQHADKIATFLGWLHDHDYCSENFSTHLSNIVKTTKKLGKEPYTSDQLIMLFNEKYRELNDKYYWIPLIGLHTGARINEICQMDKSDVKQVEGIWCFDIMSSEANSGDDKKRVKRESSKRVIPIHHRLLELGLLDYVNSRGKKKKLFDVSYTVTNGYSGSVGSYWLRYQEKCGVSGNVSFHSFRKTVINYFNQTLGLHEHEHAYYTGHALSGNEGINSYTSKKPLSDAKAMFDRLAFDIDYDKLKKRG